MTLRGLQDVSDKMRRTVFASHRKMAAHNASSFKLIVSIRTIEPSVKRYRKLSLFSIFFHSVARIIAKLLKKY